VRLEIADKVRDLALFNLPKLSWRLQSATGPQVSRDRRVKHPEGREVFARSLHRFQG
jgi:hypothetical protein